jgi:hypothetical protein
MFSRYFSGVSRGINILCWGIDTCRRRSYFKIVRRRKISNQILISWESSARRKINGSIIFGLFGSKEKELDIISNHNHFLDHRSIIQAKNFII